MCVPESQYNSDLISTTVRRLRRSGPLLFVPQLSRQIPAHTKAATLMHLRDCVSANAETLIIIMPGVKCATHSFVTFQPPTLPFCRTEAFPMVLCIYIWSLPTSWHNSRGIYKSRWSRAELWRWIENDVRRTLPNTLLGFQMTKGDRPNIGGSGVGVVGPAPVECGCDNMRKWPTNFINLTNDITKQGRCEDERPEMLRYFWMYATTRSRTVVGIYANGCDVWVSAFEERNKWRILCSLYAHAWPVQCWAG